MNFSKLWRSSLIVLLAGALCACAAGDPEATAPTTAKPAPKDPLDTFDPTPIQAEWKRLGREAFGPGPTKLPVDTIQAVLSGVEQKRDRKHLVDIYADLLGESVFFEKGALSEPGQNARKMIEEAWTHGTARPEKWPDVDGALKALDALDAEAAALIDAPLSDAAMRRQAEGTPALTLQVDRLDAESLERLSRLEALGAARTEKIATLDVAMVLALWRLQEETFRYPRPMKRDIHKKRRKPDPNPPTDPLRLRPRVAMDRAAPIHEDYHRLRKAYQRYVALHLAGAIRRLPEETPARLTMGDRDPSVVSLRARLQTEGFEPSEAPLDAEVFDGPLSGALKAFQFSRGLTLTGALNKATRKALDTPSETLVERLRLGLVRWHHSPTRATPYYVRVNVPRYEVQLVERDRVLERHDAVVGKPWKQTPRFDGKINFLEVYPWWWGLPEDPQRVPPGPRNPFGVLVFRVDPRYHLIFLHGTNQPSLLRRPYRAYSHGCIRLADPIPLAKTLINRDPGADRGEHIDTLLSMKRRTTQIHLDNPVPVFFEYNTTFVTLEGQVHFATDIYRDDRHTLSKLRLSEDPWTTWGLDPKDL